MFLCCTHVQNVVVLLSSTFTYRVSQYKESPSGRPQLPGHQDGDIGKYTVTFNTEHVQLSLRFFLAKIGRSIQILQS